MADQSDSESSIAVGPTTKSAASNDGDQLDASGQTILKLLHKAAGVAEANSKHALEMAQTLSHQLRAAEDRIGELEAEVQLYQEKAKRVLNSGSTKSSRRLRNGSSHSQKRSGDGCPVHSNPELSSSI